MAQKGLRLGGVGEGEEAAVVAAGSQERGWQAPGQLGRPGTDKEGGGHTGGLGQGAPGARAGGSAGTLSCGLGQAAASRIPPPEGVLWPFPPSSPLSVFAAPSFLPSYPPPILEASNS